MGSLFGTDGVRGEANTTLTPELAFKIGRHGAWRLARNAPAVLMVGKDTRASGDMLEAAVAAGAASVGVEVLLLGVVPTPAVAWLCGREDVAGGIVVSASHNPFEDNGIKFFSSSGCKLAPDVEAEMEESVLAEVDRLPRPQGGSIGRIWDRRDLVEGYAEHLAWIAGTPLEGLSLVLDCAHGAASGIGPGLLKGLGAEVRALSCRPDGFNINDNSGALHPDFVRRAVIETGADAGFAFDGDADRVIAVDEKGGFLDGDDIIGLLAACLHGRGMLPGPLAVVTQLSNLGLERALKERGIGVVRTDIGDRQVYYGMVENDAVLGGEPSGHIIYTRCNSSGDGLAVAALLAGIMKREGIRLSELRFPFRRYPQRLLDAEMRRREGWNDDARIAEIRERLVFCLGKDGRLIIRPSGTEKKVRIMIEGDNIDGAGMIAEELKQALEAI